MDSTGFHKELFPHRFFVLANQVYVKCDLITVAKPQQ